MSLQLNRVVIAGRLGRDPQVTTLADGGRLAILSVATSEYWTDRKSGEARSRTEWHRVVVWNRYLVGQIASRLRKGSAVYVEGRLETRRWTDDAGIDRGVTEVTVRPWQGDVKPLDRTSQDVTAGHAGKHAGMANTNTPAPNGHGPHTQPPSGQTGTSAVHTGHPPSGQHPSNQARRRGWRGDDPNAPLDAGSPDAALAGSGSRDSGSRGFGPSTRSGAT